MTAALRTRFDALWSRTGGARADEAWVRLDAGYSGTDRHYHDWRHIGAMLRDLDATLRDSDTTQDDTGAALAADTIALAIFFHDAVYDVGRMDNEVMSADLMSRYAPRSGAAAHAAEMILATATHRPSTDPATQLLLDLDLAILGAPAGAYRAYSAAVRREYAHVPEPLWRTGRGAVLDRFLARERLYGTARFRERLEDAARANLTAERLALFEAGDPVDGKPRPRRRPWPNEP